MTSPGNQVFVQPRRFRRTPAGPSARRIFERSLALVLAVAAVACETKSSTSTGPAPVKCQVSLGAPSTSLDASGGKDAVTVSTQPECTWNASSGASWITGLTPVSGQGDGRIEFQAAANPTGTARQGDVAVNDQHVPIQQKPAACRFDVTPSTQTVGPAGGTVSIAVNTLVGCAWQASVDAGWVALTATSGTGSGNVSLRVDANGGAARSTSLLVAGVTVTLTQSSATPASPNCVFSLDRSGQSIGAAGGSVTVSVAGNAVCTRTATSEAPWMTVIAGASGTGNGAVTFTVTPNTGATRVGTLTIAGLAFTVTQAAAATPPPPPAPPTPPAPPPSCSFSINPSSQSIGAAGGVGATVAIATSAGCTWTATSNDTWITVLTGSNGNGPGVVTFRIAANTGTARTGTLTIAGRTFTVNQASGCIFSINPTKQSFDNDGGAGTPVQVTSGTGCAWTAKSNDSWITVTSGATGTGNGTVRFTVASNGGNKRTGTLTIADHPFTVDQDKK